MPPPPGQVPLPSGKDVFRAFYQHKSMFDPMAMPVHKSDTFVMVENPYGQVPPHKALELAKKRFETFRSPGGQLVAIQKLISDDWTYVWVEKKYTSRLLQDKLRDFRVGLLDLKQNLSIDDLKNLLKESERSVRWVLNQIEEMRPRFSIAEVALRLNRRPSTLVLWEKKREFPSDIAPIYKHCDKGCRCRHYTEEDIKGLFLFRDRRNGFGKCDELEALPANITPEN